MTTRPDTLNELVLALKITKSKPFYKHIEKNKSQSDCV